MAKGKKTSETNPYNKDDDKVLHEAKGHVKYKRDEETTRVYARVRQYKEFAPKISVEEEGIGATGRHWVKRHDKLPLAMVQAIGPKLFALMALAAEFKLPVKGEETLAQPETKAA